MPVSSECVIEALGYDIDLTCLSETIDLFGGALEEIRHPLGDVRANEIRRPIPPERRAFLVALTQRLRLAADQKRKKRPFVPRTLSQGSVSASFGRTPLSAHSPLDAQGQRRANSRRLPRYARTHMDKRALVGKDSHPASLANVEERPRSSKGAAQGVYLLVPNAPEPFTEYLDSVSLPVAVLLRRYTRAQPIASSRLARPLVTAKAKSLSGKRVKAPISSQPSAKPIVSLIFPAPTKPPCKEAARRTPSTPALRTALTPASTSSSRRLDLSPPTPS